MLANGTFPVVAIPAEVLIIFASAIPISKNLSGNFFAKLIVFVAVAKSASNTTISEYFLIDSNFVKVSFESEFNLTKNDISLQTYPIFIGSFEIGNNFTDEEIEQAQKGEITLSNDLMFINYRLSEDLVIGDKFPTFEINETLDFEIIRRT